MRPEDFERYEAAYALLDNLTPIPADCGKLCKRKCCRGGKGDGMLLFWGEREFLGTQRFLRVSEWEFMDTTAEMAVCRGRCRREWRPLSCRIYPFVPRLTEEGVCVTPDPRARYVCPLLTPGAQQYLDPAFLAAVKEAFTGLLAVEGMPEFLQRYTAMLGQYDQFIK